MSTALRCYAVAAPGLAPLVARELEALGIHGRVDEGGVAWDGDLESLYRANLWLRTATRVIVRIAKFRTTSFWELERRADAIAWEKFVRPGASVAFRVTARKSKLYHTDAVAERLGRSAVKAVKGARLARGGGGANGHGGGADDDEEHLGEPDAQLFIVRLSRDELTLSLDGSGAPLYRRGYRQAVAKAPLRETLAAAILLGGGWVPGEPLLDPFCGSGTIPIEGALMSAGVAPGIATAGRVPRRFAFESWPGFQRAMWQACIDDARSVARSSTARIIRGSDRDEGAIAAARANADRAGVSASIDFAVAPVSAMVPPDGGSGMVATNPPYGVRIGDEAGVRRLYAAFGRALRERAAGWHVAMVSADPRLDGITAGELGGRLVERIRTRNGGIPVRIVSSER